MATELTPWKTDPAVDELVPSGAHLVGVSEDKLVKDAVRAYIEMRREQLHREKVEALRRVDDSDRSLVAMLTGVTPEEIDAVGGVRQ